MSCGGACGEGGESSVRAWFASCRASSSRVPRSETQSDPQAWEGEGLPLVPTWLSEKGL